MMGKLSGGSRTSISAPLRIRQLAELRLKTQLIYGEIIQEDVGSCFGIFGVSSVLGNLLTSWVQILVEECLMSSKKGKIAAHSLPYLKKQPLI